MAKPQIYVDGHTLVIEIDLSAAAIAKAPLSGSGKTKLLLSERFTAITCDGAPKGLMVNGQVMVPAVVEEPDEEPAPRRARRPVTEVAREVERKPATVTKLRKRG